MKSLTKTKVFQAVLAIIVGVVAGLSLADLFSSYMEGGWRIATDITFAISGAMLSYVLVGPREFLAEFRNQISILKEDLSEYATIKRVIRIGELREIAKKKRFLRENDDLVKNYKEESKLDLQSYLIVSSYWIFVPIIISVFLGSFLFTDFLVLRILWSISFLFSLVATAFSIVGIIITLICHQFFVVGHVSDMVYENVQSLYRDHHGIVYSRDHAEAVSQKRLNQSRENLRKIMPTVFWPKVFKTFLNYLERIIHKLKMGWILTPILIAKTLYAVQSTVRLTVAISTLVGFATGWTYDYNRIVGCLAGTSVGLMVIAISKLGLRFLPDPNLSIDDYKEFALAESKR